MTTHTSAATQRQWFFFRVQQTKKRAYRFNLVNLSHHIPALQRGMRPAVISEFAYKHGGTGWQRVGEDVTYHRTGAGGGTSASDFTYSFTYTFEHAKDVVYFALAPPYTYTQLQNVIFQLHGDPELRRDFTVKPLCRTLAGNRCDLLDLEKHSGELRRIENSKKKAIFVTARAHGGETQSSWMAEGLIRFLLGGAPTANLLRQNFVFYIVPMLNPDGVVNGQSRCNIAGKDLNTHWDAPVAALQPTVYHLKKLLREVQARSTVVAFIDLHGQAVRSGFCLYSGGSASASAAADPAPTPTTDRVLPSTEEAQRADPRHFNIAIARRSSLVSLRHCSLLYHRRKEGSVRVVAAHEFYVPLSVQVMAPLCRGPSKG
ncbi:hypothetical protein B484DRAFT_329208, partial [Ochromonadaceae sp. CCMP2298]